MIIKVIGCTLFKEMIEPSLYPNHDFIFFDLESHNHPQKLKEQIQQEINVSQNYHAICLLYGICGNATIGLTSAHVPLYLFKAHDCAAICLGDNQTYQSCFGTSFSYQWTSMYHQKICSFKQTKQSYYDTYGIEQGNYLWSLHTNQPCIFVDFNHHENDSIYEDVTNTIKIEKRIAGTTQLITMILELNISPMILKVNPKEVIHAVYDFEKIIYSK